MKFKGYGADAEFDGNVLHLTARNALTGTATLGAQERIIPIESVDDVSLKEATVLTNGNLTVHVGTERYVVHFLKKAQTDAVALHGAVVRAAAERRHALSLDVAGPVVLDPLHVHRVSVTGDETNRVTTEHEPTDTSRALGDTTLRPHSVDQDASEPVVDRRAELARSRRQSRDAAAAARADKMAAVVADRREAKTVKAVAKEEKRAGKVAVIEARAAALQAFSDGSLASHVAEHGLPEGFEAWLQVDGYLVAAAAHAKAGRIEDEEKSIRIALSVAKNKGGRTVRKAAELRVTATTGRTLRIGSSYVGTVTAEDFFSQHGRKKKLTSVVTAEKWLEVRSDRVISPNKAHPLDANTTAQVYLDGQSLVSQRPTLTRMALLSPLPGTALIPGLALQKKETVDTRQGEFQVGGLGWSIRVMVHPDQLSGPRQMAEQINRRAGALDVAAAPAPTRAVAPAGASAAATPAPSAGESVLDKLERIQALRASGALTQDEADALKRGVLEP